MFEVGHLVFKVDKQARTNRIGQILEIRQHDRPLLVLWFETGAINWTDDWGVMHICWLAGDPLEGVKYDASR